MGKYEIKGPIFCQISEWQFVGALVSVSVSFVKPFSSLHCSIPSFLAIN